MTTLVYIHGHGASGDTFNYIKSMCADDPSITITYDSKHGFDRNLAEMLALLDDTDDAFFIAHSLGGIYAAHLADRLGERCIGGVTMATPYGGSEAALFLGMIHSQQIYMDIHPGALPIVAGRMAVLPANWTAIVTTRGHAHSPLMSAANDGIVTDASMRNRKGVRFVDVPSNHFEVVQSQQTVDIIREAIAA